MLSRGESVSLRGLEKGLDSVIGDSEGQEETMSSGAVCQPSSLVLGGPAPEASETSEKLPVT